MSLSNNSIISGASLSVELLIRRFRGKKVILDFDLARIYGVPTKVFNQAIKRNIEKFPEDFLFRLTQEEAKLSLGRNRSQIVTGSQKHRDPRQLPYAFTEHGAIMAANVLNSRQAVQMSVFVVRAFLRMRSVFAERQELAAELAALEKKLTERLDTHESAIVDILKRIMTILDPPPAPLPPPKPKMGF